MAGAGRAVQYAGQVRDADRGLEAVRIHGLDAGRIQQIATLGGQQRRVRRLAAGIGGEVLAGAKLARIDEDRGHCALRVFARQVNQRGMARM